MTLQQLRYVITVAQKGSISEAAKRIIYFHSLVYLMQLKN